jgi:hypothetical protein
MIVSAPLAPFFHRQGSSAMFDTVEDPKVGPKGGFRRNQILTETARRRHYRGRGRAAGAQLLTRCRATSGPVRASFLTTITCLIQGRAGFPTGKFDQGRRNNPKSTGLSLFFLDVLTQLNPLSHGLRCGRRLSSASRCAK